MELQMLRRSTIVTTQCDIPDRAKQCLIVALITLKYIFSLFVILVLFLLRKLVQPKKELQQKIDKLEEEV
ncbi:hypothetical protein EI200_16675 [Peribacillus simplex]|uniref:hypothetical protein n=1 Tax=Peribacillus simplex TaxID=1478 RepID=UPI000F633D3C|nr:hypothetical protein [Peribacillus simplex]RRN69558.1 hypothetical protein EI200_16675 [Peribacillus simplex]